VRFSVRPSILLNSRECSPLGVNEGVNIPSRGLILPLGARGEVTNDPQHYGQRQINPNVQCSVISGSLNAMFQFYPT
jgi:hypothetical protein